MAVALLATARGEQTVTVTAADGEISAISVNGQNLVPFPFSIAMFDHTAAPNDYSNPVALSTQVNLEGTDTIAFVITATMPASNPKLPKDKPYTVTSLEVQLPPLSVTVPALDTTNSAYGGGGDVPMLDASTPDFEWFLLDGNYPATGSAWQTAGRQWMLRIGSSNGGPMPASATASGSWNGGQVYIFTFRYRFADAGADLYSSNTDLMQTWVAANTPFGQQWLDHSQVSDNRPIGFFTACSNPAANNPAGWNEGDPSIDVHARNFPATLETKLTNLVNACITNMQSTGGQGFIWWDYCGDPQFPDCMYVGDPRVLPRMQPVLNRFIDKLFSKVRNNRLTPGVAIRDDAVFHSDRHWSCIDYPTETMRRAQLSAKIRYAYERWAGGGKFLIYIDSWKGTPDTLQYLAHTYPNVLLLPELQYPAAFDYLYTAPFAMVNLYRDASPAPLKPFIPWCKQYSYCGNETPGDISLPNVVRGIQSGDIMGLHAWWTGNFEWTTLLPQVQGSWPTSFFPTLLAVPAYLGLGPPLNSNGLASIANPGASLFFAFAPGQFVTYLLPNIPAGTYDVRVEVKEGSMNGQWQLQAGSAGAFAATQVAVGSAQDGYGAKALDRVFNLGSWTAPAKGDYWFRFTVTGKNAQSAGYNEAFESITLIPQ